MRNYELITIVKPSITPEEVKEVSQKIEKLIETHGGQEIATEQWGRRELAYELNKEAHGSYVRFTYNSDKSDINAELTRELRINDSLLKFQMHRLGQPKRSTSKAA